jgi:hypothetical protein
MLRHPVQAPELRSTPRAAACWTQKTLGLLWHWCRFLNYRPGFYAHCPTPTSLKGNACTKRNRLGSDCITKRSKREEVTMSGSVGQKSESASIFRHFRGSRTHRVRFKTWLPSRHAVCLDHRRRNRASTFRRDSAEAQWAHFGKSSAYTSSRLSDIIGAFVNSYGIPCTMAGDEN